MNHIKLFKERFDSGEHLKPVPARPAKNNRCRNNVSSPWRDWIREKCKTYRIENYSINSDGSIDVDGDVNLSKKGLDKIPLRFRKVTGDFYCYDNYLKTLYGSPKFVGRDYNCNGNTSLQSLEGGPEEVIGDYVCLGCRLTSLKGGPKIVKKDYSCWYNNLTSLEGIPSVVKYLDCNNNKIYSFEFWPKNNRFNIEGNPIENLWNLFKDESKIELLNDYDVARGDEIILDRLNGFLQEIGKNTVESVKGYKCI